MTLALYNDPIPLEADREGVIRIRGTRVPLDTVVAAFNDGATAEEIAHQYPTVDLPAIYAVIGFFLHHRDEVGQYLAERARQAQTVRQENNARFPPDSIRARLLQRGRT